MITRLAFVVLTFVAGFAGLLAKPVRPPAPPDFSKVKAEALKKYAGAEVLVVGKLTQVTAGPVGLSEPPLRTYRTPIAVEKFLRGSVNLDKPLIANYSVRQQAEPKFPSATTATVIALKQVRGMWTIQGFEEATPDVISQATMATSFPLGWTIKDGKLVSPWAGVGKPAKAEGIACSVTGRPVLAAGNVRFNVEPMPPAKAVQFANPDGDGLYKLTVTNESKNEVEVPALLTDGKTIRWDESIVIRCQDKTYPIPGSTGNIVGLKSVLLKPGESVTGTTHVFALKGPQWPMGGYRIEFQFCLAELSVTQSFYYLSRHHDPIRAAVLKSVK